MQEASRIAIVLNPKLSGGQAANAAAIVSGGLLCDAFLDPIQGRDGALHAAIRWNLVVLAAKSEAFLYKVTQSAKEMSVRAVLFSSRGQELSNSFDSYEEEMRASDAESLNLMAVGLYGSDAAVRLLTKPCSLFK